jgi:hypothetical protein
VKLFRISILVCTIILSNQILASDVVKIHAPVTESYNCTEHWDGQFKYLGDALGTDCVVQEFHEADERLFMRPFKNNGFKNEDWFGYGKNILAPCDCSVEKIHINKVTNTPGKMTPGRASSISFKKPDGTIVLIAHVANIKIAESDIVKAGDIVATIGNNGYSRNPHIHIAAWRKDQPLQIRFNQKTIDLKSRKEQNK